MFRWNTSEFQRRLMYLNRSLGNKGVSEMLSYVLLIVIAVGISVLVYSFLYSNIPKDNIPKCPNEVSLIFLEGKCNLSSNILNLTVQNKGLFNADGISISLHPTEREVQSILSGSQAYLFESALKPGEKALLGPFSIKSGYTQGEYGLDIQAMTRDEKGNGVPCGESIIKRNITCSA